MGIEEGENEEGLCVGVGRKNLLEETLGLGNMGVPSSFVASLWLEDKGGW